MARTARYVVPVVVTAITDGASPRFGLPVRGPKYFASRYADGLLRGVLWRQVEDRGTAFVIEVDTDDATHAILSAQPDVEVLA